jgi:hypothetical protein
VAETERTSIVETPSGPIELVLVQGAFLTLQFNCDCMDALPYCKALCCRMRSGVNVLLDPDEIGKFKSKPYRGNYILQSNPETDACAHLSAKCECTVHQDKPRMCRAWHCSPGGKGEGIQVRDGGWFMSPLFGNQQQAG